MTKRAKRTPYSRERNAEALALARIAGAEVSSDRTHIPVQTIRRWMDVAGIQPGTELPQDRLEALRDLAEATVTRDLVEGRLHGVQAMTVAGIARRHIAKPEPDPVQSALAARELFFAWLVEIVDDGSVQSDEALAATVAAIEEVPQFLLRRANVETPEGVENHHRRSVWEVKPHRAAILAWHSGRTDRPAGDILKWSKVQILEVVETHGSLTAWHAWQVEEDRAEKTERARLASEARATAEQAR